MREIRFRIRSPDADHPRRDEDRERRSGSGARLLAGVALATIAVYLLDTRPVPDAVATADPDRVELVGKGEPRRLTITSGGSSPLRIHGVTVRGRDSAEFAIVREACAHAYLLHGESCSVDLRFLGRAEGRGELLVTGNAEDGPLVVGLHGATSGGAAAAGLRFEPQAIDFGREPGSASRDVVLASVGDADLRVSTMTLEGEGFRLDAGNCKEALLAPGERCGIRIESLTGAAVPRRARLLVTDNAPGSPQSVPIRVEARASVSRLVAEPLSMEFGREDVARAGKTRAVIVTAEGEAPVQIARIAVEPKGEFRVVNDYCGGRTLSGGQSCRLGVLFVPGAAGARSGRLEVVPRAPSEGVQIALAGTGVLRPDLEIAPNPLVFEATPQGTRSEGEIRVTPNRKTLSRFAKATVSGQDRHDFAIAKDGCKDKVLNAIPSCTIRIRFTPRGIGERGATLALTAQDGSAGKPLATIDLRGQGVSKSSFVLEPPSLSFAVDQMNVASAPQTVVITKTGPGTLAVESVMILEGGGLGMDLASALGAGNPSRHFKASGECAGKVLGEGNRCEIAVRFAPSAYGDHHGFLAVKPSGSPFPVTARLEGKGPIEPQGWCCVNGHLLPKTAQECGSMKGKFFALGDKEVADQQCTVIF